MKTETIIEAVCDWFDVTPDKLVIKSRKREYVVARQVSMYFLKQYTTMSLRKIGETFGGRDHTTAIHSVRTVQWLMDSYESFTDDIKAIELKINNQK